MEKAGVREVSLKEAREVAKERRLERLHHKARDIRAAHQCMIEHCQGHGQWVKQVPDCPVYFPTPEEFEDPLAYIRSIQPTAARYGVVKIVPPFFPAVPAAQVLNDNAPDKRQFTFHARLQELKPVRWSSWDSGDFAIRSRKYSLPEYAAAAAAYAAKRTGSAAAMPPAHVEIEYWRQRSEGPAAAAGGSGGGDKGGGGGGHGGGAACVVEYANDVVGSGFARPDSGDPLGGSKWNLNVLPEQRGTLLPYLAYPIPGVTSPMLYIGMLHATFAWHIEDHYLYSINYHHMGAPKTWYGVPASGADAFEDAAMHAYAPVLEAEARAGVPEAERRDHALASLLNKTTVLHPQLLLERGVAVYRAVQAAGEFVVTFPRAYHAGFSHGFNCGEAVNFGMHEWLPFCAAADARLARLRRRILLPGDCMACCAAMDAIAHLAPARQQRQQQQQQRRGLAGAARSSEQGDAAADAAAGSEAPAEAAAAAAHERGGPEAGEGAGGRLAPGGRSWAAGPASGRCGPAPLGAAQHCARSAAAAGGRCGGAAGASADGAAAAAGSAQKDQGGGADAPPQPPPRAYHECASVWLPERRPGALLAAVRAALEEGRAGRPPPLLSTLLCFWRLVRKHATHARELLAAGASLAALAPDAEDTVCSLCEASCFLGAATAVAFQDAEKGPQAQCRCLACAASELLPGEPAVPGAHGGNGTQHQQQQQQQPRSERSATTTNAAAGVVIHTNGRLRCFAPWVRLLDGLLASYDGPATVLDCSGEGLRETQLYGEGSGLGPEVYGWDRPHVWGAPLAGWLGLDEGSAEGHALALGAKEQSDGEEAEAEAEEEEEEEETVSLSFGSEAGAEPTASGDAAIPHAQVVQHARSAPVAACSGGEGSKSDDDVPLSVRSRHLRVARWAAGPAQQRERHAPPHGAEREGSGEAEQGGRRETHSSAPTATGTPRGGEGQSPRSAATAVDAPAAAGSDGADEGGHGAMQACTSAAMACEAGVHAEAGAAPGSGAAGQQAPSKAPSKRDREDEAFAEPADRPLHEAGTASGAVPQPQVATPSNPCSPKLNAAHAEAAHVQLAPPLPAPSSPASPAAGPLLGQHTSAAGTPAAVTEAAAEAVGAVAAAAQAHSGQACAQTGAATVTRAPIVLGSGAALGARPCGLPRVPVLLASRAPEQQQAQQWPAAASRDASAAACAAAPQGPLQPATALQPATPPHAATLRLAQHAPTYVPQLQQHAPPCAPSTLALTREQAAARRRSSGSAGGARPDAGQHITLLHVHVDQLQRAASCDQQVMLQLDQRGGHGHGPALVPAAAATQGVLLDRCHPSHQLDLLLAPAALPAHGGQQQQHAQAPACAAIPECGPASQLALQRPGAPAVATSRLLPLNAPPLLSELNAKLEGGELPAAGSMEHEYKAQEPAIVACVLELAFAPSIVLAARDGKRAVFRRRVYRCSSHGQSRTLGLRADDVALCLVGGDGAWHPAATAGSKGESALSCWMEALLLSLWKWAGLPHGALAYGVKHVAELACNAAWPHTVLLLDQVRGLRHALCRAQQGLLASTLETLIAGVHDSRPRGAVADGSALVACLGGCQPTHAHMASEQPQYARAWPAAGGLEGNAATPPLHAFARGPSAQLLRSASDTIGIPPAQYNSTPGASQGWGALQSCPQQAAQPLAPAPSGGLRPWPHPHRLSAPGADSGVPLLANGVGALHGAPNRAQVDGSAQLRLLHAPSGGRVPPPLLAWTPAKLESASQDARGQAETFQATTLPWRFGGARPSLSGCTTVVSPFDEAGADDECDIKSGPPCTSYAPVRPPAGIAAAAAAARLRVEERKRAVMRQLGGAPLEVAGPAPMWEQAPVQALELQQRQQAPTQRICGGAAVHALAVDVRVHRDDTTQGRFAQHSVAQGSALPFGKRHHPSEQHPQFLCQDEVSPTCTGQLGAGFGQGNQQPRGLVHFIRSAPPAAFTATAATPFESAAAAAPAHKRPRSAGAWAQGGGLDPQGGLDAFQGRAAVPTYLASAEMPPPASAQFRLQDNRF